MTTTRPSPSRFCDGRLQVDVICLTLAYDGDNGEWLRVKALADGSYVGKVRTPAELTRLGVDLSKLKEVA